MNNYTSSAILEKIKTLCDIRYGKGKVKETIINCGLSYSVIDNLRKGSIPSADKLAMIADGLQCSTDYLLGRASLPALTDDIYNDMELSSDESQLISHYRNISPQEQYKLLGRAELLAEQEETFRQDEA